MAKVKFIPNHIEVKCYRCGGKNPYCPNCKGTGTYTQTHYHLIYTNKKGQKMCFGVDTIK